MNVNVIMRAVAAVAAAAIYLAGAVKVESQSPHNLEIDAGRPLVAVWPCEVAVVGEEGEKGLRIAPKIGRGWRGEAAGQANYTFFVPAEGKYTLWGYCLWYDVCSNAIFVRIDDEPRAILGNDPIYERWHWVRGFDVHLQKGTHRLQLANHSDHIAVQKMFLSDSPVGEPANCKEYFSDIFYDGFDGCDQGNFSQWRAREGQWQVYNPEKKMCTADNALVGVSEERGLIVLQNDEWSGYSLNVSVRTEKANRSGAAGICIGLRNPEEYYLLKWSPMGKEGRVRMQMEQRDANQSRLLSKFESDWKTDVWHEVGITLQSGRVLVEVDGGRAHATTVKESLAGGIGFYLEGEITAYFDNVHVRQGRRR